jgi:signal peptide peptidase SppA
MSNQQPHEHEIVAVPRFGRVHDYVGAWAIEPASASALLSLARGMDLAAHVAAAQSEPTQMKSAMSVQPDGRGKSLAVVPIVGVMMKHQSSLGGGTSTVQIRRDLRAAASSDEVSAILLHVDSPGGTVAGTADLGDEVRAAARRKPVYAFVSDLCASAAYWVASQADAVYANHATALIGSIGTVMTMYDMSRAAEQQGVETLVFATGPLKGAGAEGAAISEEQRAYFQALVDDAQRSFDAAVRKGRSLTDLQLKAVRTGGVFGAAEAEERKLIDGVRSLEATVEALVRAAHSRGRRAEDDVEVGDPIPVEEQQPRAEVEAEAPSQQSEPYALRVRLLRAAS